MRTEYAWPSRILLLVIFVFSHFTLAGCNNDSRTTGTMLQVSEEEKARLKAKVEKYKGGSPLSKKAAAIKAKKEKK
jgi:hypothetical protein